MRIKLYEKFHFEGFENKDPEIILFDNIRIDTNGEINFYKEHNFIKSIIPFYYKYELM